MSEHGDRRCPLTYMPCGDQLYSLQGLKQLDRRLSELQVLPFTSYQQRIEATTRMTKMSVQGVQPKLSAVLNIKASMIELVDANGDYIIKPQSDIYPFVPENEDVTMKMAAICGIETPWHGLIWCADGSLSYMTRRFDKTSKKHKIPVEDFSQLTGKTRETKYDFTIEKMLPIIEKYCTFPVIEKEKFFRLILFCFLTGNEDMHLKNFSLMTRNHKVTFTPAYDLINSTLILGKSEDEMALMLAGRRKEFRKKELIEYFGIEKLGLTPKAVNAVLTRFGAVLPKCIQILERSFLEIEQKEKYKAIMTERARRLSFV